MGNPLFLRSLLLLAGISVLHVGGALVVPAAEAAVATDSLVGYWKFDEGSAGTCSGGSDICDSSGHGNHGTRGGVDGTNNLPQWDAAEKPVLSYTNSHAMDFDGTDDYVLAGSLTVGKTITAWGYFTGTTSGNYRLWSHGNLDNAILLSNNNYFAYYDGSHLGGVGGTGFLERWVHFAITFDGTNAHMYLDGDEKKVGARTENIDTESLVIAAATNFTTPWRGFVDDVRIYSRALTGSEITQLAAGNHPTAIWDGSSTTNWETADNWDISAVPDPFTNVIIRQTGSGSPVLSASVSGLSLTIESSAILDLAGYDLEFTDGGALKGGGTLKLRGDETLENIVNSGTGTVYYYGSGSYTGLAAGNNYYNLAIEDPTRHGLLGYWKFDETATGTFLDSSGNGNHGTGLGAAGTNKTPQPATEKPSLSFINERALDFDGTDDHVDVGTVTTSMPQGTFSLWAYTRSSDHVSAPGILFAPRQGSTSAGFILHNFSDTAIGLVGRNSTGTTIFTHSTIIVGDYIDQWAHFVVTFDGSTVKIYRDGEEQLSVSYQSGQEGQSLSTDGEWSIGEYTTFSRHFDGLLDDVRIYNRALYPAEVESLADGHYALSPSGTATFTLNDNLDVSSLTIHAGILSAGSHAIDVSSNWNNYSGTGGFVAGTSTVDLDGSSSQSIRGSTNFYNLEISTASTQTVSFGSGTTQAVSSALTFTGQPSNLLTLAPLTASTAWYLDVSDSATQTLSYVSPSYSNASPGVAVACTDNCTDGGNNVSWQFTVPTVAFSASAQTVSETGSTLTVTLSLSAATTVDVFVPFTVTGTATDDGTDYTLVHTSPARIAAGQTGTGITITLTNDGIVEADESIILTMGSPTNATQGGTTVHTVTVTSEDLPSVSFQSGSLTLAESAGTATITITLSGASVADVTIPFSIGGTATGTGGDYTVLTPSPLILEAGETSTGIILTLIDDSAIEVDETVVFTIGTPVNALTGATLTHTITITSDDVAPASSSSAASSSSTARVQSGGGRGSGNYSRERIEAAFEYILSLFDGKRDEQRQIIADDDRRQRLDAVAEADSRLQLAARRREERIAQRIAEQEELVARLLEEKSVLQEQYAARREERLARALAEKEVELKEQQLALQQEEEALRKEQERNRLERERRIAERQEEIAHENQNPDDPSDSGESAPSMTDPALIAARRNRLFAVVNNQPVIYTDVSIDEWYAPYVSYVVEEEIAQGYDDAEGNPTGEFGPANAVTRAEMLKMALEAAHAVLQPGSPRNKTAAGSWAALYVATAEHLQLRVFTPATDVHLPATRGEVVQTILEVMNIPTGIKLPSPFRDVPGDHAYAQAITTASAYGLVQGDSAADGTPLNLFRPDDSINRAEVAKIIALVREVTR